MLKKMPPNEGHKIIILGTSGQGSVLKDLEIWSCFDLKVHVPELESSRKEIHTVLDHLLGKDLASKLKVPSDISMPIKSLSFVAESLELKLADDPTLNANDVFNGLISRSLQ